MAKRKKYKSNVYQSFALIMQFGINMLVPICLMTALGVWIDKKAGTSYFVIILFFVGAIAGGRNVFKMSKGVYDRQRTDIDDKQIKTD